jgi:tripartite-type tricarboxylate transporter receptor subunit TctC
VQNKADLDIGVGAELARHDFRAVLASGTVPALAQSNYPDRNIRLLFGFTPGVDTAARLLADRLRVALGKAVIVENVTGASGHIAAERVAKSGPDGYTIGLMPAANIVVDGTLYKRLPYDPLKDLVPVTQVYGYTDVLVVNNDVPAKDVTGLVALARAKPGQLTYGHSGVGTSLHLAGELFNAMAHVDVQQVPFRGSSLVITDVIGGRITMSFIPPIGTLSIILEGNPMQSRFRLGRWRLRGRILFRPAAPASERVLFALPHGPKSSTETPT